MGCGGSKNYDLGKLDFTYFEEERIIGKGGFGTVYAVRKKYGTKEEQQVFLAAKELDKAKIIKVKGLAEMTMNELGFMVQISEGTSLLSSECPVGGSP
jgi:hypothetical protein